MSKRAAAVFTASVLALCAVDPLSAGRGSAQNPEPNAAAAEAPCSLSGTIHFQQHNPEFSTRRLVLFQAGTRWGGSAILHKAGVDRAEVAAVDRGTGDVW